MEKEFKGSRTVLLGALALALAATLGAQSTTSSTTPADSSQTAQPAPGTAPVAGDAAPPPPSATADNKEQGSDAKGKKDKDKKDKGKKDKDKDKDEAEAGTTPVKGDSDAKVDPDKVVAVGGDLRKVKPGSVEDVSAVGNRDIGGRGLGNWYSTDTEIKMGKSYADEIEKSSKFITDPVITEYVNRVGQNIVKNSDCKVPFTIKVLDSDEINAFALPGGFFYVNSGLILNADEEAELAGVMAHETAHVCAHHAVRQMTRMNYAQLGTIPLIFIGGWTGYGIYEAASIGIPITFMRFSREFESQADFLGVQYMYRSGYDPQAFITFFEKIQALEKRKPGAVAKVFADHPQTPDRILHSQEEIARILPARDEYMVTTSEFDEVKARLARIENKRRLTDNKGAAKPSLRRASTGADPSSQTGDDTNSNGDDRPTLHRRDDQQ
ncbi:MAG TPA: M48 family metallopeptidase [Terracidiphilus sp.]|jgi:beta-barrel assembly-enhancing protease|nr:M48 family metallopeptidase [Terracidiphilus sp.]